MHVITKHLRLRMSENVSQQRNKSSHVKRLKPGWDLLSFGVTDSQDCEQEDRRPDHLVHESPADREEFTGISREDASSRRLCSGRHSLAVVEGRQGIIVAGKRIHMLNQSVRGRGCVSHLR